MSRLVATFTDETALLEATRAARAAGIAIEDAYTPYAIHGLDEAMGLRRSRLTWVCFLAGATGAVTAMGFQLWASVVSWPLNVGGKPFASYPAFIPITFELTVLSAALMSAAAFLFRSRLFPGRTTAEAAHVPLRVTDDRFALVVADGDAARALLRGAGAVALETGAGS
jgi:hypothetical protein